jgi:hypothetical protein
LKPLSGTLISICCSRQARDRTRETDLRRQLRMFRFNLGGLLAEAPDTFSLDRL